MKLTKAEVEADLNATELDIEALDRIVQNLRFFIQASHGEDRSAFRVDLLKYEALAEQARTLRTRIRRVMSSVTLD